MHRGGVGYLLNGLRRIAKCAAKACMAQELALLASTGKPPTVLRYTRQRVRIDRSAMRWYTGVRFEHLSAVFIVALLTINAITKVSETPS